MVTSLCLCLKNGKSAADIEDEKKKMVAAIEELEEKKKKEIAAIEELAEKKKQIEMDIEKLVPVKQKADEDWKKSSDINNLSGGSNRKTLFFSRNIEEIQWVHYDYKWSPWRNTLNWDLAPWTKGEEAKWTEELNAWKKQHPVGDRHWCFFLEAGEEEEGDKVGLYPRG